MLRNVIDSAAYFKAKCVESFLENTRVMSSFDKFLQEAKKERFLPDNTSTGIKNKKRTNPAVTMLLMLWVNACSAALIWTVINLSVPSLRRVTFLRSMLWKWSLLAYVITAKVHLKFFASVCVGGMGMEVQQLAYFAGGLKESVVRLVHLTSILLTWLLCVNTDYTLPHRHVTFTLSSFLVGALLSVLKSLTLLRWKKKYIYRKYEGKILAAAFQLFFLLRIIAEKPISKELLVKWQKLISKRSGRRDVLIFSMEGDLGVADNVEWLLISRFLLIPCGILREKPDVPEKPDVRQEGQVLVDVTEKPGDQGRKVVRPIEKYMLSKSVGILEIEKIATCLTGNFEFTLKGDEDVPDIVRKLQQKFTCDKSDPITQQLLEDKLSLDTTYAELLLDVLKKELCKEDVSYKEFEKWAVLEGLKRCLWVGETLKGALQMMQILDRVLTGFIVVVVIVILLVITGLNTTKVVVALASIVVGLSFMCKDTCTTFFQGAIFSFVIHPFDIGDRCIVDNKKLQVIKMNITTTTFSQNQKEIVKYPNLILASKVITILRGEPEPADPENVIELNLHSSITTSQILSLQERIERCLEDGIRSGRYKRPYGVMVKDNGDRINISVHYEHNLDDKDVKDQVESPQFRKNKQRSKFLLQIRQFIEDVSVNQGYSNASKGFIVPLTQHP